MRAYREAVGARRIAYGSAYEAEGLIMAEMSYASAGVEYPVLDAFKRLAQSAARRTAQNLARHGLSEAAWSRGESAYLLEQPRSGGVRHWAHVHEGLGTKNIVADEVHRTMGGRFYRSIAQDTVAAAVNDIITLGALPVCVAMHLAVGSGRWFADTTRAEDLVAGWADACDLAGCAWGGGETPTLKGIVHRKHAELSCSVIGLVPEGQRPIGPRIRRGDAIVLLESSGIHANGLSMARLLASRLPGGYSSLLDDGRTLGESLLVPTVIYVPVVEACRRRGIDVHYAVNITGHGWRKLMRADLAAVYVIDRLPRPQPVFQFIMRNAPLSEAEAYATLNMGAGFALYVAEEDATAVVAEAESAGIRGFVAGHVDAAWPDEPSHGRKRLVLSPLGLEYGSDTLQVR